MKNSKLLVAFTLMSLFGCQSTTQLRADKEADIASNSTVSYITAEGLKDEANIEVPPGFNVKEFVKLSIAPYLVEVSMDKDSLENSIDTGMPAKMLGGELSRTERFNVLTRTCNACDYEVAFQAENTVAEGAIEHGKAKNPDYVLEANLQLGTSTKLIKDSNGSYYELTFRSTVSAQLIDGTTKEIKHTFPPIRQNLSPKKYAKSSNNGYLAGFKYFDKEAINQAYQEAAQKSLQVLVTDVMAQFPIGGKAKHYRSERFAIAAGSSQGIPKQGVKIPAVIFQDDFGIAIPLASGYITPGGSDTSMFEVIQWKNSDKDAMDIKKKLDAMGREYVSRNKIYAVSVGTPEDWKL
ncbi:penicillin-binding protein activator LpoB [Photobacterium chitinilyticum]|uniref:Penicillin-binding protein activator LpoB n=1 Tax=Photobacterium chitinilyticum TaxID=2485123 RepID=A0A3S3R1D9_9GAMM|nr:penicillin-binding protein activator LpoB [Photobacterium chitinilyticum]RWX55647.1 penicillin-binding protein activator LpoB [Photobacterium chitinilyticum]